MLKLLIFLYITHLSFAQAPNWVGDKSLLCGSSSICAVGEGLSLDQSHRNARVNLSKYFNTEIKSTFQSSLASKDQHVFDEMMEEITEKTLESLEGVDILKSEETKTGFYSLAKVNKIKMAEKIEREILDLDGKISTLIEDKAANSLVRAEYLILQREILNERHIFLVSKSIKASYSIDSIRTSKAQKLKDIVLNIKIDEVEPKEIGAIVKDVFSQIGYQISSELVENKKNFLIDGEINYRKEYLNVDGFEKYRISISLKSFNDNIQQGSCLVEFVNTGRNLNQIIESLRSEIKEKLKAEINNLKI